MLCNVQGRSFVLSVINGYGSEKIKKTFMKSVTVKELDSRYNCKQCFEDTCLFDEFMEIAGNIFKKNDEVYKWLQKQLDRIMYMPLKNIKIIYIKK